MKQKSRVLPYCIFFLLLICQQGYAGQGFHILFNNKTAKTITVTPTSDPHGCFYTDGKSYSINDNSGSQVKAGKQSFNTSISVSSGNILDVYTEADEAFLTKCGTQADGFPYQEYKVSIPGTGNISSLTESYKVYHYKLAPAEPCGGFALEKLICYIVKDSKTKTLNYVLTPQDVMNYTEDCTSDSSQQCKTINIEYYTSTPSHNIFISYFSPDDVETLANYANEKSINQYMFWTVEGDISPKSDKNASLMHKLFNTINSNNQTNSTISAYWKNWGVYTRHAYPNKAYPIPGSIKGNSVTNEIAYNQDLVEKLSVVNNLVYAFLEAQPKTYVLKGKTKNSPTPGELYFSDPWADLGVQDNSSAFCKKHTNICTYAYLKVGKPTSGKKDSEIYKMSNFRAFSNLKKIYPDLKLTLAVGGYLHWDSFEATFNQPGTKTTNVTDGMKNFASSLVAIMEEYNIDGVDLDYENPRMTHEDSKNFHTLIKTIAGYFDKSTLKSPFITIDSLSNPAYIAGTDSDYGFADGVLKNIAKINYVKSINLMTYDFNGAFNYDPATKTGYTGLLSNTYPISPQNQKLVGNDFSVVAAVKAVKDAGVSLSKVALGIPTYGRALANISSANSGLYQKITAESKILPGNLDPQDCKQNLVLTEKQTKNGDVQCSGEFSYRFIVESLLNNGFTNKEQTALLPSNSLSVTSSKGNGQSVSNGMIAYAEKWRPAYLMKPILPKVSVNSTIVNNSKYGIYYYINGALQEATDGKPYNINPGKTFTIPAGSFTENSTVKVVVNWKGTNTAYDCSGKLSSSKTNIVMVTSSIEPGGCSITHSTAYKQTGHTHVAADNTLELSNYGAYGIVVKLNSLSSGYIAPKKNISLDNTSDPSVKNLQGVDGIKVKWTTWSGGPSGSCVNFNFAKNTHIMINSSTKACTIKTW
jgi:GH18 family chitinase